MLMSCSGDIADPDLYPKAFKGERVIMKTTTSKPPIGVPITLTTTVDAALTGKGRMELTGTGSYAGSKWTLEYPFKDTLTSFSSDYIFLPAELICTADSTSKVEWVVILQDNVSYSFRARAVMDSIFI